MNDQISEILNGFKVYDGVYKKELVEAAIELKKEITPFLINILNRVLSSPYEHIDHDNYFDHIYALMLLGHFKEHRTHKVIVDLFGLPDAIPDRLFGDITTSDLPVILLNTCGGSIDLIKTLALNKRANDYCRIPALNAMAYAVVENIITREDVLAFYSQLFTGNETNSDSDFWGLLACLVCDLYPEELKKKKKNLKDLPVGIRAEEALKKAVADAIADHKRSGDSIVTWRDGRVVKIPADQIEIREDQAEYESK